MEPKFQSSFIPKGPIASPSSKHLSAAVGSKSLVGFVSKLVFILTLVLCAGIFGYNKYLSYTISQAGNEIEAALASLDTEGVKELIRLDNRIVSTRRLLGQHVMLSPLFEFLENSTLQSVRFTDFSFLTTDDGLELSVTGEARGYSAVALQAEAFASSDYFKDSVFSDLRLDESGNVVFSMTTMVDPGLVSYRRIVERDAVLTVPVLPEEELEEDAGTSSVETSTSTVSTTSPQTQP